MVFAIYIYKTKYYFQKVSAKIHPESSVYLCAGLSSRRHGEEKFEIRRLKVRSLRWLLLPSACVPFFSRWRWWYRRRRNLKFPALRSYATFLRRKNSFVLHFHWLDRIHHHHNHHHKSNKNPINSNGGCGGGQRRTYRKIF